MTNFPLTAFLIAMRKCSTDALRGCNPVKLAEKYSIRPDWAKEYIELELEIRGSVEQKTAA